MKIEGPTSPDGRFGASGGNGAAACVSSGVQFAVISNFPVNSVLSITLRPSKRERKKSTFGIGAPTALNWLIPRNCWPHPRAGGLPGSSGGGGLLGIWRLTAALFGWN